MAKDAPKMRGNRSRNKSNGRLRDTRDDKHAGTLEKQYNRDFDARSDMHTGTLLKKTGKKSVSELINSKKSKKIVHTKVSALKKVPKGFVNTIPKNSTQNFQNPLSKIAPIVWGYLLRY